MWGVCMPNFSPPASMVWEDNEEEEVTDRRTEVKHSRTPPSLCFVGIRNNVFLGLGSFAQCKFAQYKFANHAILPNYNERACMGGTMRVHGKTSAHSPAGLD